MKFNYSNFKINYYFNSWVLIFSLSSLLIFLLLLHLIISRIEYLFLFLWNTNFTFYSFLIRGPFFLSPPALIFSSISLAYSSIYSSPSYIKSIIYYYYHWFIFIFLFLFIIIIINIEWIQSKIIILRIRVILFF